MESTHIMNTNIDSHIQYSTSINYIHGNYYAQQIHSTYIDIEWGNSSVYISL